MSEANGNTKLAYWLISFMATVILALAVLLWGFVDQRLTKLENQVYILDRLVVYKFPPVNSSGDLPQ